MNLFADSDIIRTVKTIDLFSDASHGPLGYTGAYVIDCREPIGVRFDPACRSTVDAEMLTAAAALRAALALFPKAKPILHQDLASIQDILRRGRTIAARQLQAAIDLTGADAPRAEGRRVPQLFNAYISVS